MTQNCGCCEGTHALTPAAIDNPAGLDWLTYRVGTHGSFLTTMLARLSGHELPPPGGQPLAALTARTGDDPTVALLDAWATVADVLTFYTERIANEGYLATATERHSLLELARLVGYRLRPGVAASVLLAYTLDRNPAGGDSTATIPRGARAQSVPAPGELPQTFETSEELLAHASWNVLRPQQTQPILIDSDTADTLGVIYLEGITTGLRPNDRMLAVFKPDESGQDVDPAVLHVVSATAEPAEDRTRVELLPAPVTALFATLERLAARLADHRDLERAGLAGGRRAERIDAGTLAPLERAARRLEPDQLQAALASALPGLRGELADVRRRRFGNLATWLEAVVADLSDAELAARRAAAAVRGNGRAARALALPASPFDVLDDLREPLVRPPSRPPADPAELERSAPELFTVGSDVGPQLLVALNPPLAPVLYTAWANAPIGEPSPLDRLQGLRVRAAPFGATAPRKPVLAVNGVPVDTEEWPLESATRVRLGVEVIYSFGSTTVPASAHLELVTADGVIAADVALNGNSQSVSLPPATVSITDTRPTGGTPSLTFQLSGLGSRTITVVGPEPTVISLAGATVPIGGGPLAVTLDAAAGQTFQPDVGQRLHRTVGTRSFTVKLERTSSGFNFGPLTVTDDAYGAPTERKLLPLDAIYDRIVPDTWVVIERKGSRLLRRATGVETVAKAAYGITGKVTQLTLSDDWLDGSDVFLSDIRETVINAQTELVTLAREPRTDDVAGDEITLDALYNGLQTGRTLVVSGERTDVAGATGVRASEPVMVAGVVQAAAAGDSVRTTIHLAEPLAYTYLRDTVEILGNVAKATHGEGGQEVLGSGDGGVATQSFTLRRSPLTYVAAANPRGVEAALEVFVDEIRWHQADSLVFLGPTDHGYVTSTDDADKTTVTFGNGVNGARLPTGEENLTGAYRVGIGGAGNVGAGRITQLQTRPLGVGGVTNPLPASGGADRDGVEQARRNVPLGVLALDRLVSVADYEDFTRARAGIGKASARRLSDGIATVVHLTVSGADDSRIEASSDLLRNLRLALYAFSDPALPVRVAARELVLLVVAAGVHVLPDHQWLVVEREVRAALLEHFAYERRDLGQDVLLGEVLGTVQAVPGVDWVRVEAMTTVPEDVDSAGLAALAGELAVPPDPRIPLDLAHLDTDADPPVIRPAQLAFLSAKVPDTLILNERG